ncbi:thioesterase domain-containing protein [Segnochrobactrum spirostomi]|uniref:thioesterase domain-containing protein n=1 Tax=Segnochrobactrum spirostomi TaxID=2608987 RepID=UPI0035E45B70
MPGDRPFWALQAPGLEDGQEPIGRVEDLAAYNLAALARRGLPAPRLLGGYSFGGIVAFEMARQLAARGARPERLVIIDTPAPVGVATSILSDDVDVAQAQWLVRMADVRARHHGTDRPFEIEDLLPLGAEARFDFAVKRMNEWGLLPEGADAAWLWRAHRTGLVLYRALLDYRPSADPHSRDLPLRLVRASTLRHGDLGQSELAVVEAPAMGWERVVRVPISVESVPGDHISMLDVRRVLLTADVIGRFLGS